MWHTNQGMTMHTPQTASIPSLHIFHPQLNFPTIRWHWLQLCSGRGSHCVPEESDHRLQPDSSYTEHWPELCSVILYAHKQAEITLVSWWHFRFAISSIGVCPGYSWCGHCRLSICAEGPLAHGVRNIVTKKSPVQLKILSVVTKPNFLLYCSRQ